MQIFGNDIWNSIITMKKANDEQNQFVQKLENLSVRLDRENLL